MLHPDRDLPLEAAQLRLPGGEVLGLGVARDLREDGAGARRAQLQLGQVAPPRFAFAPSVAERRIARIVGAPQRFVGTVRFRLRPLQFAVEMRIAALTTCDVRAQQSAASRHSSTCRME